MIDRATQTLLESAERVALADVSEQDRWWSARAPRERARLRALWENTLQIRDLGEHGYPVTTRLITIDRLQPSLADASPELCTLLNRTCATGR